MEGYDVITNNGDKLGRVVRKQGDNLIVEHGTLFKARHALPLAFAHVDDAEGAVRTTVSKELNQDSPKVGDDGVDETAVAAYYGLPGAESIEGSEGYGVLNADDPAETADQVSLREGIAPAEQERAEIRRNLEGGATYGPAGRPVIPPDPHTSSRVGDEG